MEEKSKKGVPLTALGSGKAGIILDFIGGAHFRQKLFNLGLLPGMRFTVEQGGGGAPFLIHAAGTRVMIGRGMAEKIMVKPAGTS